MYIYPHFIFVPFAIVFSGQILDWANSKQILYLLCSNEIVLIPQLCLGEFKMGRNYFQV